MRRNISIVFALLASVLIQSCARSLNVPSAPSQPESSPCGQQNIMSAFATIGNAAAFYNDGPMGIQYFNNHLWLCNFSTNLQEWATVGTAPLITIWNYNSGTNFTSLNGDGIDPASGNVYVCDTGHFQVAVFNPTGGYVAEFGSAQMAPIAAYQNGAEPYGVAVNSAGTTVYVVGLMSNTVYVYSIGGTPSSPSYTYQYSFGNTGSGAVTLNAPCNLRVDGNGNVWVADIDNHRVAEFSGTGSYLRSFMSSCDGSDFSPADVLVDGSGNVYAVDTYYDGVVVKFNPTGQVMGQFGQGVLSGAFGITTDGAGNFYVTNYNPQQIVVFH